jgi:hypothetical protein
MSTARRVLALPLPVDQSRRIAKRQQCQQGHDDGGTAPVRVQIRIEYGDGHLSASLLCNELKTADVEVSPTPVRWDAATDVAHTPPETGALDRR